MVVNHILAMSTLPSKLQDTNFQSWVIQ